MTADHAKHDTRLFKGLARDRVDGELYPVYIVVQDPTLVSLWQVARETEARILNDGTLVSIEAIHGEVIHWSADTPLTSPEALLQITAINVANGKRYPIYVVLWDLPYSPLWQILKEIEDQSFDGLWGLEILDVDLVVLPVQKREVPS
jgi:hypothetical protein